MIFSGQRLGQGAAGQVGQPVSATVATTASPAAGSVSGVKQSILPAKVLAIAPVPLGVGSVAGTIGQAGGVVAPVPVANPSVVGSWIGNKAVKPVGNQVVVNKWQEGLVARSSDVAKTVGNQAGKAPNGTGQSGTGQSGTGQSGTGQNGKGAGSRSSSSWW